jgi:L-ascorbate metabolism protein UlaG (beta-lactamase superfamily)
MRRSLISALFGLAIFAAAASGFSHTAQAAGPMLAQTPAPPPEMTESCPGLIASRRPTLQRVQLKEDQVRITYVGHSTFLIESPQLVRVATDYNDYVKPPIVPNIVTMNRAHSTHYTDRPEPTIDHVLRGWSDGERPALHDVQFKDVRVRNVPTNIRSWGGATERHGNSIFIFELGNLCIAHLGHLHHTLTQQQLNEIGRVDIVLVPVDGTYTLDLDGMMEVLQSLKAQMMIPMHFFSSYTLNRFLERARQHFEVETSEIPSVVVSKTTLPGKQTVMVLPGR